MRILLICFVLLIAISSLTGCGPGIDGYKDTSNKQNEEESEHGDNPLFELPNKIQDKSDEMDSMFELPNKIQDKSDEMDSILELPTNITK